MSELRLSVATGEWVVFAPERAKRPEDFHREVSEWTHQRPTWKGECPFCPGHDSRTPGETLCFSDETSGWLVRSFPNRFPVVSPGARPELRGEEMARWLQGVGHHEVVAESPVHNTTLALMAPTHLSLVLKAWRQRYRTFWLQPETEHVVIFKNHGLAAGCSLEHPHSQVVALPVTPRQVLDRQQVANHYYHQHGRCVFCDEMEMELRQRTRVLGETKEFVAFIPYAAFSPFSIWILPRRHSCSYALTTDAELEELAVLLRQLLARLYHGLGDPPYNLVVRSSHAEILGGRVFHWYITIVPRLQKSAGFELGTGMFINTSMPENDAQFLRQVELPQDLSDQRTPEARQRIDVSQQTVEVVDLDNRVVDHVSRSSMREQNLLHRAVKILVYNCQGEIFVHRRTSTKDLFPGMHDVFVGGVVESGESYLEAARRVLRTELGIGEASPEFVCSHFHQGARSRAWIHIFRLQWAGPMEFHPDHIEWSAWVPEADLPAWTCRMAIVPMGLDCFFAYQDWLKTKA